MLHLLLGLVYCGCFVIDGILVLITVAKSGLGLLIFFMKGVCVCSTLRMEEHHLSFWGTKTLGVPNVLGYQTMHKARNQAGVRLGRAPSNERTGLVCQQSLTQRFEKEVGES